MNQEILKAKEAIVKEVAENMKKSSSIVVVEYRGMTVAEMTELRRTLRKDNATMTVYKNSLVERAADELGYHDLKTTLVGPNALIFSEDTIAGPKIAAKFAKKHEDLMIKGGVVEGRVVDAAGIKTVATLPGREGLISMFLSCLQAPVRNFACAVKAVAEKEN